VSLRHEIVDARIVERGAAAPAAITVAPAEDRRRSDDPASAVAHARGRGTSGSRGGSGGHETSSPSSSGEAPSEGGDNHGGTAAPVADERNASLAARASATVNLRSTILICASAIARAWATVLGRSLLAAAQALRGP